MLSSCLCHGRFKQFSRNKCLFVFATADLNSMQGTKPGLRNRTSNTGPGAVVRKPINLIQDQRKLLLHVFNVLVKVSFAYFCFSRLTSSNLTFYRISALNSIWE